jgi:hypothetical protein
MNKIAAAFVAAKRSFAPLLKDKTNPAFRSKYADLGACIDSVEDALLANGIAFYQETTEDAAGVTIETVFLHESGETLRCGKLHVPAIKHDPQGFGSALTYARRYSLTAACGIAPEDDDGNAASKPRPAVKAVAATGGGTISAPRIAYEALDMTWRNWIDAWAVDVQNTHEQAGPQAAHELIETTVVKEGLENEHRVALWHKLPSKVRSDIDALTKSPRKAA